MAMKRRIHPTSSPVQRPRRVVPRIEGLETRVVLSTVALAAAAAPSAETATFPLRTTRFSGLFQGSYTYGPSRAQGFATQLYMKGGGNTSAFYHGDVQINIQYPDDPTQPAVGRANLLPKDATDSGDQLVLDLQGIPGQVDRGGRLNRYTWTVNSTSGGRYGNSEGSGTFDLQYFPSHRLPRGATAAGRLGIVVRGALSVNPVAGVMW